MEVNILSLVHGWHCIVIGFEVAVLYNIENGFHTSQLPNILSFHLHPQSKVGINSMTTFV